METSNSCSNHVVLHAQNDRLCLDPYTLVIQVQKSLFCMQKPQIRAGTYRDKLFWC